MQKKLNQEQVAAFYHDEFVRQQVDHFRKIALHAVRPGAVVADIGGGCGYFASAIKKELNFFTRVIDMDPVSVESARRHGVEAMVGDALQPDKKNDEALVCFNLILHHLVATSENETLALQARAISNWRQGGAKVFVNEYIYESWFGDLSGWLIYQITKSKFLSNVGLIVSKFIPSLRANTFGVGVRFRSGSEWRRIFENSGFMVEAELKGDEELISVPRRLLLIKSIRRDSFLLAAK
jgi:hypothetical protein